VLLFSTLSRIGNSGWAAEQQQYNVYNKMMHHFLLLYKTYYRSRSNDYGQAGNLKKREEVTYALGFYT